MILDIDKKVTKNFVKIVENFMPMKQLKTHYTALEISCHGIPWIVLVLASIWIISNKNLYQMQINLLIALLLDIVIIGLLKAVTRRRRPAINTDPFAMGPDKYSFPSGHASRPMLLLYFFYYLWPVPVICIPPLVAWLVAVALSRLLMRRHYILDIYAGLVIGYAEGILMSILYLEPGTCLYLVSWLTDVRMDIGDSAE
ncbi:Presqualene diphosphate phosphatase [Dufourea novaeangliae]|uniref:Presqualene diphosphate phosphatase n=2 Tax=Dufourea novaeangliae TaxID=178035 RepID=A0A154PJQ5_DUFNO|nr:Presqualene diphosphate phosphatase [Dufourea novaeangliae]